MRREDAIWAAIRIFGIYFIVRAVMAVPAAIGGIYLIYVMASLGDLSDASESLKSVRTLGLAKGGTAVVALCEIVLFTCAGLLFIRGFPTLEKRIAGYLPRSDEAA